MAKELSEMTLKELWELFPIILKDYNEDYPKWYEEEKEKLVKNFTDDTLVRISHIGSTAVPGLLSKPIIDILMEVSTKCDVKHITDKLKSMGWIMMSSVDTPSFKQSYNKGYTKYGFAEKVYHLHLRYCDSWNELYFRDYLIEHSEAAKEYADLKLKLKEKYEHNRDAYTDAKEELVLYYSNLAREKYNDRYKIDGRFRSNVKTQIS
jgi:GrpB-like predicted nucleotidyltransferase (UPF0157 family)